MKRIYLIRHGKAEEGFGKSDFERDLIDKGIKKTKKVAAFLAQQNPQIELMLVSMASRTIQTAEIVAEHLSIPESAVQIEKALYLASSNGILDTIFGVDDQIENLVIVGHNPGISSLATYLSKKEDLDWMPTSAIAAIELKTDKWNKIPDAKSKLIFYKKPADI
jgi:phosphohistidine phosphatase